MSKYVDSADHYRVQPCGTSFQPEMLYQCFKGEMWVPLKEDGYWADPNCFSTGEVTVSSPMTEEQAKRAIWRARIINKVHR